jgi:hypothetical protein
MTSKLIIAIGLVTLALLTACNKTEETAEAKTATTEQAPAVAAAPVAESAPAPEVAPASK